MQKINTVVAFLFLLTLNTAMAKEVPKFKAIEGKYPCGIKIETLSTNINTPKEHETITLYQKGKVVDRIETVRAYALYYVDLNDDGYKELIFKIYDGGRKFDWVVVTIQPKMQKAMIFERMAELSVLLEIDGKPVLESWELYGSIFAAEMAYATLYANFNGTHFHLNKALQKKELATFKMPQKAAAVSLGNNGYLDTNDSKALINIITYAVHAWYAGEGEKAIDVLSRRVYADDRATMYLFLQYLVQELSWSRFWEDIIHFNGWEDSFYDDDDAELSCSYQELKRDDVVNLLYERLLKEGIRLGKGLLR